jgi:hypothetical protein
MEGAVLSKTTGRICLSIFLAAAILALAGCPPSVSIADINKDPGRYAGKEVTISGTASDSFGAMGNGIFRMDDGTGSMWVFSQNFGVPGSGNKVAVTGRVEQGFSFGGRSYAVILRETKERH